MRRKGTRWEVTQALGHMLLMIEKLGTPLVRFAGGRRQGCDARQMSTTTKVLSVGDSMSCSNQSHCFVALFDSLDWKGPRTVVMPDTAMKHS